MPTAKNEFGGIRRRLTGLTAALGYSSQGVARFSRQIGLDAANLFGQVMAYGSKIRCQQLFQLLRIRVDPFINIQLSSSVSDPAMAARPGSRLTGTGQFGLAVGAGLARDADSSHLGAIDAQCRQFSAPQTACV